MTPVTCCPSGGGLAGVEGSALQIYGFEYDFDVHGGAIGVVTLTPLRGPIPDNFMTPGIAPRWCEGVITPTSGGAAEISIGYSPGAGNELFSFVAYDSGQFDADSVTDALTAGAFKFAAVTSITLEISTAALTGGKINVYVAGAQGVA